MVDWVVEAARAVDADPLVVVTSPEGAGAFDGVEVAVQAEPRGTGDALAAARTALDGVDGDLFVLSGDAPALSPGLLRDLLEAHRREDAAATILSFRPADPREYGRIIRDDEGAVREIVEAGDATPEQLAVDEVNSAIYVFAADRIWPALDRIDTANTQGELYLTDAVRHLVENGERVAAYVAPDPAEAEGVNTRAELADAAAALRDRINEAHMLAGVTIVDPKTTWIEADVELEPDATIHPFTVLSGQTKVGAGAVVGPHAVAVDAVIGPRGDRRAVLLPSPWNGSRSAREGRDIRGDQELAHRRGCESAAPLVHRRRRRRGGHEHRRRRDHRQLPSGARPGQVQDRRSAATSIPAVHNVFVAPVTVGDNAWVAAGSVVTKNVPPGALAIARSRQVNKEGFDDRNRHD